MKGIFEKYGHFLLLLYFPLYLAVFHLLEVSDPSKIHVIDCSLDQMIPFVEVFVVPYLLWFLYMIVTGVYFMFWDKESFVRMMFFGMFGMTLFLLISWVYPNGLDLRPDVFARDNIFVDLVKMVYSMDTATNVLPSIHVFNSVGVCIAIHLSKKLQKRPLVLFGADVLTVLIIMSTMLIKQHSVVDVLSGLALSYVAWELVYNQGLERIFVAVDGLLGILGISQSSHYGKKKVPHWLSK